MKNNITDLLLQHIINSSNLPIVIDFWAPWCAPCKIFNNTINEIKTIFKKKIKLIKLNIDYNKFSAEKFSIKNLPTLIIIKNKNILLKRFGYINKEYIKFNLNQILNEK